jgi:hypothetical protein
MKFTYCSTVAAILTITALQAIPALAQTRVFVAAPRRLEVERFCLQTLLVLGGSNCPDDYFRSREM